MTAKKWLVCFLCTVLAIAAALAAFNLLTDPFGVFGDRVLNWYSYNETNNPRAAKIEYLKQHHDAYDSYIVGCSSTSSFPQEDLNRYYGASFYNMIMYGADMLDVEQTCNYLFANYTVKNLVLNVYIDNGMSYDYESSPYTDSMSALADGSSKAAFYSRFLFANPTYGAAKLKNRAKDTWLPQAFDVFDEKSGAYDKRKRDVENISDLESYIAAYPVFTNYPQTSCSLPNTAKCMESVGRIAAACKAQGVALTVVCAPVYYKYMENFPKADVENFYRSLADVTDYWDFSMSSVSFEPRYFYDGTHFRNAVGKMALARMFDDDSVYIPEDFGQLVTMDSAADRDAAPAEEASFTANVPILMYHHLTEENGNSVTIAPANFEAHMAALADGGYTAVTFDDLIAYVDSGAPLPEKPVVITFDDGYESNYHYAYPILSKYHMCATIFAIGHSVGKDTYKDTGSAITPHFSADEAREMVQSGVINVQSHTYDMHQSTKFETGTVRETVVQLAGESERDYIAALKADFERSRAELTAATGEAVNVLAYPQGVFTDLSEAVLRSAGVRVTLGTSPACNTVIKGLPQSLYGMHRYGINDSVSVETVLQYVAPARG